MFMFLNSCGENGGGWGRVITDRQAEGIKGVYRSAHGNRTRIGGRTQPF